MASPPSAGWRPRCWPTPWPQPARASSPPPGARHRLLEVLPVGAHRAAVVTQPGIDVVVDAGVEQRSFLMPEGEEAKCLETVEELCRAWARWGLTRADVVVAVGGGVVTDAAGF